MSLNWQFRNGTIGDLSDEGESLFAMCTYMMMTGVPKITTDEEANLFMRRVTEATIVSGDDLKTLPRIYAYTDELLERGITTNVSKKTKTQWKSTLNRIMDERVNRIIKNGVGQ